MTRRGPGGLGPDDVRRIAEEGEGSRVEFKRGLPRATKVARTLAAFANTRGGTFLVGIDDDGALVGAPHPDETAQRLREIAEQDVEPPVPVQVGVLRVDGARIVAAVVGLSAARPHSVVRENDTREVPVRVGSSTRAARGPTLAALRSQPTAGLSGLSPLERDVLRWVGAQGDGGTRAAGEVTPRAYALARNIGATRARRAFVKLERAGYLVAHGSGSSRTYDRP